jgi:hypothetical protein
MPLGNFADACGINSKTDHEKFEIVCYYLAKEKGEDVFFFKDVYMVFEDENIVISDRPAMEKQIKRSSALKIRLDGAFKFDPYAFGSLDKKYGHLLTERIQETTPPSGNELLPPERFCGKRETFDSLIEQINMTYAYGYYDACALTMRRLLGSALILALQSKGMEKDVVADDGKYLCYKDIVKKAVSMNIMNADDLSSAAGIGDHSDKGAAYAFGANDINSSRTAYRNTLEALLKMV